MTQEGNWTITPVDDPLQAVRNMDIVVTSIPPADVRPVTGEALTPGTLLIPLDLVNSWQDNVLLAADRVAADNPDGFLRSSARQASNGVSGAQGGRQDPGSCRRKIGAGFGLRSKPRRGVRDRQHGCRGWLGNLPPGQCGEYRA